MIRTLLPLDAVRLDPKWFGGNSAYTLDRMGSPSQDAPSLTFIGRGIPLRGRCALVWEEEGRLIGMASARRRSGPTAWEVDALYLAPEADAEYLLERLSANIAQRGGQRLFLRLPWSSPIQSSATRCGFVPLVRETLYRLDRPPHGLSSAIVHPGIRPKRPWDHQGLFHLYLQSTPAGLRDQWALTLAEWQDSLERGAPFCTQRVAVEEDAVVAWLMVWGRTSEGHLWLLCLPGSEDRVRTLLEHSLGLLQGRGSIFSLVPEFQGHVASGLEALDFREASQYLTLVKGMAVKVKAPALAPA
ncbi:MAG: hypothetical protein HYU29_04685 [Chloroflexi bacterium]|nr:hypothetical protein [Chloroflexota bacterium]